MKHDLEARLRDVNQVIYPVCNEAANEIKRLKQALRTVYLHSKEEEIKRFCKDVVDKSP